MSATNVDHGNLDVRLSIVGIENDKEKPVVTAGGHAEKNPIFEEQEGKKVFPTKVVQKDDGSIVVMYKKNGEVETITLDEYASKKIIQNRKIKGAKAVPAKKATKGSKGTKTEGR